MKTNPWDNFTHLLQWSTSEQFVTYLDKIFVDYVSRACGRFFRRLFEEDPGSALNLQKRLQRVSDDVFMNILTAPQTFYLLVNCERPQTTAAFLGDSLDAAQSSPGKYGSRLTGVWSALGDRYLVPDDMDRGSLANAEWNERRTFLSPRTPNGIPIDFYSPFTRGALPEVSGDDVRMEDEERIITLRRLDSAFIGLERACPRASKFALHFSKVIVVRRDSIPSHFTSASTRLCIGRTILRNPHLEDVSPEVLVDGIIHETIHGVIDIIELEQPMIIEKSVEREHIASGWTGRELNLNTYLQACFVWFGLWNLWYTCLQSSAFDRQEVIKLLNLASRGFTGEGIVQRLECHRKGINPNVLTALEMAQRKAASDIDLIQQACSNEAP